jgi:hypothetical protein
MQKYKVMIPRLIQCMEYETIIVNANSIEEAEENALMYENVEESTWHCDNQDTIKRYDHLIEVKEIKNVS